MFRIAKSSEANIKVQVIYENEDLNANKDTESDEDRYEKWYLIN